MQQQAPALAAEAAESAKQSCTGRDWHASENSRRIRIVSGFGQIVAHESTAGAHARVTFEPEFRFAVECCRCSFSGGATDATAALAERVNWQEVTQIAQFHRVQGLVSTALGVAAPETRLRGGTSLAHEALGIAEENLRATLASRELLEAFGSSGIPLLFMKGLTLGALAYGNPALKSAIDIDLLIDPKDLGKAAAVLRLCDFQLVTPDASVGDRTLLNWHGPWKESVWARASPPLQLDLHTRLADNPRLIPGIDVHSPRQLVDIGNGVCLPTLATDELFAYLAVHGASSAWFRLKWISDFAGLIHRCAPTNLESLYRRSQELGAGRAAGQALLLADELFGTLGNSPRLGDELRRDRATMRLFRTALLFLTAEPVEPTERRWGTLPIHRTQFDLHPGIGYKLSEISSQVRRRMTRTS